MKPTLWSKKALLVSGPAGNEIEVLETPMESPFGGSWMVPAGVIYDGMEKNMETHGNSYNKWVVCDYALMPSFLANPR